MDAKAIALGGLKGAFGLLMKDLNAMPEDSFDKCFGGKARTAADIIYELNLVNDHIGLTIRGEELFDFPEGWLKAPEDKRTKEAVIASFKASSEKILETVENFSTEEIEGTIMSDGSETTRFERCRFMAVHSWYHSGQLNFMQTLMGDDVWHWQV